MACSACATLSSIHILPPDLASQIAAGEVVERPASAVKELVENSLDAGASRVDVEITGGGITLLSVADDGCGMDAGDARLAVERHATSKIATLHELERITSFGFRGEALPSIASVSRLTIRTRAADLDEGTEVTVEGGAAPLARPVGMPRGTVVEARDLFYNVPARRKFLRASGTEAGHVTRVLDAAALSRPECTFTLVRDGRRAREWLRAASREERVRGAFADDALARCAGERGPLRVEAYLSRPERARSGAGGLELLVNGRPVRDRALLHAVAQAYGSVLERGRYPRGVVYLELPPELVDVNVHPQKGEVRFADPRAVGDALYRITSVALASAFSLPTPSRAAWGAPRGSEPSESRPNPGHRVNSAVTQDDPVRAAEPPGTTAAAPRVAESPVHEVRDSTASRAAPRTEVRWSDLRFVAQVRQTYLLCEGTDGLYVLDQHAAAERVTFDRLRRQYLDKAIPSQALLFPLTLDVTATELELIEERIADFAAVGLDLRPRGTDAVSVHTIPRLLTRASPERLVRDLLAEVARTGGRAFSDAIDLALATMACHGSVRAGDPLSRDEAAALLSSLDRADFAGHCPHGRPVVTFTSWSELERQVGRR